MTLDYETQQLKEYSEELEQQSKRLDKVAKELPDHDNTIETEQSIEQLTAELNRNCKILEMAAIKYETN